MLFVTLLEWTIVVEKNLKKNYSCRKKLLLSFYRFVEKTILFNDLIWNSIVEEKTLIEIYCCDFLDLQKKCFI